MNAVFLNRYAQKMAAETGRPITPAEAKDEVGRIIVDVSSKYGRKFRFGFYEADDIASEAAGMALECLAKGKYDFSLPLENYLHRHIKRRLHNLKRDRFMRPEAPCKCCDQWNPGPSPCPKWVAWNERNGKKQALARSGPAADMAESADRQEASDRELSREIDEWVDETWPAALRADYLRLKQGVGLTPPRLAAVKDRLMARFGEFAHAD